MMMTDWLDRIVRDLFATDRKTCPTCKTRERNAERERALACERIFWTRGNNEPPRADVYPLDRMIRQEVTES